MENQHVKEVIEEVTKKKSNNKVVFIGVKYPNGEIDHRQDKQASN
jgi:hypothetical protein